MFGFETINVRPAKKNMPPKINIRIKNRRKELLQKKTDYQVFEWHTCKNCDYRFEGNFCPSCGQSVKDIQKPVRHFFGDVFDSLLVFDFRLIRSLPLLLLKPGRISEEYVDGKRKKYLPPFRFFLFSSIVFFFLIGYQTRQAIKPYLESSKGQEMADSVFQAMKDRGQVNSSGDTVLALANLGESIGLYEMLIRSLEESLKDSTLSEEERARKEWRLRSMGNPNYVTNQIFKYVSWTFFILMPFYALILRLFFRKKRKYYVEHLVFSVNIHTFYFVLLSILVLLSIIFGDILKGMTPWILLVAFLYAMFGVRNFYRQGWVGSIFYTLASFVIYLLSTFIIILISVILIFLIF